ncbi:MAG: hypothetical protein HUJ94_04485 [Bacteroidales bacterium]|nr:hypothetical protein [Bacteroidales bacterium]
MKKSTKYILTALLAVPLLFLAGTFATFWFAYNHKTEKEEGKMAIHYRNAEDLERATGVEFPEVELLDSLSYKDYDRRYVRVHFSNPADEDRKFERRLKKACRKDSGHWGADKGNTTYTFLIFPESLPVDRSTGDRMEQTPDGRKIPARSGDYLKVIVPANGSAITVEEGWQRYARE